MSKDCSGFGQASDTDSIISIIIIIYSHTLYFTTSVVFVDGAAAGEFPKVAVHAFSMMRLHNVQIGRSYAYTLPL